MKTTELRIGNYVNGIYDEGEFIAEVLTVDSEGCLLDANGIYELTSLKVIKPIPLTEEWLIKFGLKYHDLNGDSGYYQILTKNGIFQILYSENDERFIFNNQWVDYVHELQNIFYFNVLTNEELTIKL